MKLFLDDVRIPQKCLRYMNTRLGLEYKIYKEDWVVVRNYKEFMNAVINNGGKITHVSFDHDLAREHITFFFENGGHEDPPNPLLANFTEKTGYDCATFLKTYYEENKFKLPKIYIHSKNPIGTKNIKKLFSKHQKFDYEKWQKRSSNSI